MSKIYASTSPEPTAQEMENLKKVRSYAADGMVLLKNDGALPLKKPASVALYGYGVRHPYTGGGGSSEVKGRHSVNIQEGFEAAGYIVTNNKWLEQYEENNDRHHNEYMNALREDIKNGKPPMAALFTSTFYPAPPHIPDKSELAPADAAILVISRSSGEGNDRKPIADDYYLTDGEIKMISYLARTYCRFIIVLNTCGVVDLTPIKSLPGVGAILLMGLSGSVTGEALADVISGDVTPSGKLTATWAASYNDYPGAEHFSTLDGNLDDAFYKEDIYVGYRYFDSFNITPAYCFGHGLSYTDFNIEALSVSADENAVDVTVKVTNIGDKYCGREVVQVYSSAPWGELEKPYQELVAYGKTRLLAPGEAQIMKLVFSPRDLGSYSEKHAAWILEKGMYYIRVGASSRSTKIVAALKLDNTVTLCEHKNLMPLDVDMELLSPTHAEMYSYTGEDDEKAAAPVISLIGDRFVTEEARYRQPLEALVSNRAEPLTLDDVKSGKATLDDLVAQLTVDEMAALCVGIGWETDTLGSMIGSSAETVPGAAGETTSTLNGSRRLGSLVMADGPSGLRLTTEFGVDENGNTVSLASDMPSMDGIFGDFFPEAPKPKAEKPQNVTHYYQYTTALPVATVLAQSWDDRLIHDAGALVGGEMTRLGVNLWLAPGMNIHKNPLGGRNFEYYSEDPLLTGLCASAITKGVQSFPGCGTTIKHFACNNQETNRNFYVSHVSQRALREIYLKGFEICVKQSKPYSVMTSYNLINGTHSADNYDLCTAALRDEWGFDGLVMTDWGTTTCGLVGNFAADKDFLDIGKNMSQPIPSRCMYAGNDLIMPGYMMDVDNIKAAVGAREGEVKFPLSIAYLQNCAKNIIRVMLTFEV